MPITDPNALAAIVSNFGGTVVEARTFQFTLPLSEVRTAVPQITQMAGVGCRKIEGGDFVEQSADGDRTVVRLELYNKAEAPSEPLSLLERVIR